MRVLLAQYFVQTLAMPVSGIWREPPGNPRYAAFSYFFQEATHHSALFFYYNLRPSASGPALPLFLLMIFRPTSLHCESQCVSLCLIESESPNCALGFHEMP